MTLILVVSQGGPPGSVDDIIDPGLTRSPSELSCVLRTRESKERSSEMTVSSRSQVGIVGAGPAGLLLSHLLALRGIDSIVVENRSRAYCEARQRAGLLEAGTVELLRAVGLGERVDAEGLEPGGVHLRVAGEGPRRDFRALPGGRWVTIYAQTEIVKDLIRARLAAGAMIEFEVSGTEVGELDTDRPGPPFPTP